MLTQDGLWAEEIILSKAGKPLAKLVPYQRSPKPRQPGGWEGQVRISEDFDAPMPLEIQAAFEGVDKEITAPAREGTSPSPT